MSYSAWSVVFGETPSAAKWNILGTNDAAFNDGTGIPSANATTATVSNSQSTASTSATDLSTSGPSVTVTIGATGMALLTAAFTTENASTTGSGRGFYVISGATTVSATEFFSARSPTATQGIRPHGVILLTSLNPGSNTFKLQYATTAGTQTFASRVIGVIPL